MNEDIQTADPRLRRITLVALALAGVAALAVVVAFHHWMTRQAAVLPAEQLVARLRLWIGIAMTASGLCLLLLAGCAARLARTTLDQRRWPPSSLRVLRDTPVRREAAAAAVAMYQAGETFRVDMAEGVPPIGMTRVGLHVGDAIVGNFGGEDRIQYTALGDSMNTASRLESANKKLKTSVIASREAVSRSGLDWWRPMGRVTLRGRATPVDIFEPQPNCAHGALSHIQLIIDRIDAGDVAAIAELEALVARLPGDAALANLVYRMQSVKPGGSYALD